MAFAVAVPWWVLIALVGAAGFVAYWAYARPAVPLSPRQRGALSALRFVTLLVILLFLLRPVAITPVSTRDAAVPILLDASRSMRVADVNGERRIDHATRLVRDEILPGLATQFQVELFTFGDHVATTDLVGVEPDAPRTDLTGAIAAVADRYRGRSVAGIVMLSDGGDTGQDDVALVADGGDVAPVYAIGVGAAEARHDLEVVDLTTGHPTMSASVIDVGVSVVGHGRGGGPIELRLLEDGRLLDVRRVTPPDEGVPVRTVFQVSPNLDLATLYTVEIPIDREEVVTENNTRSVLVAPPGRPRRVLMIEGAPGYDHSFLKRAWLADSGVSLDAVVRKGQNDRGEHTFYVQGDPARTAALATGYPVERTALFAYDAVVLANVETEFFRPDQLAMTAAFVEERGGGLLIFGSASLTSPGLTGSPLEELLPLELSDRGQRIGATGPPVALHTAMLTNDGAAHPIMRLAPTERESRNRWDRMPALADSVAMGAPRAGASVLALVGRHGGEAGPLIAVQRYGRGRTMVFTGEAAWKWKMLLPADDRAYELFWGQTARWLASAAPEPVTLAPSARSLSPGDVVRLDVHVRDDEHAPVFDASPMIEVTTPEGQTRTLSAVPAEDVAGHYVAEFRTEVPGVYRVDATVVRDGASRSTAHDWLLVGGANAEFADPRLNEEVLRRIATASGGRLVDADDLSALPDLLRAGAPNLAPPVTRDLWHGLWSFLLVLVALTVEWTLRRAWGMR